METLHILEHYLSQYSRETVVEYCWQFVWENWIFMMFYIEKLNIHEITRWTSTYLLCSRKQLVIELIVKYLTESLGTKKLNSVACKKQVLKVKHDPKIFPRTSENIEDLKMNLYLLCFCSVYILIIWVYN